MTQPNTLYFGDNLDILRAHVAAETVDLIYLDPPFNSKRDSIYFQDDKTAAKKIIVSVKGGESVTLTMLKDLIATVEHERAQLGLFVTLASPTKPMLAQAASAGFYESPNHGAFPKIQILTIEGLLAGNEAPRYPDLARGAISFRQAKTEKKRGKQGKLL